MLIKVTNQCGMGCSHCMEDSTPAGAHMSMDVFERALAFTARVEALAWASGCLRFVLLSGGECTEHPEIVTMIEKVLVRGWSPLLISNGMWLADRALREAILRPEWPGLMVQVTNDPRFYPTAPPRVEDPRLVYVDSLTQLLPLGRLARKKDPPALPLHKAPSSFNLRSAVRTFHSFEAGVAMLRQRALAGKSGHCTPSIADNGDVLVGETRSCWKVGTVDSTNQELTEAVLAMGTCNRCGLESGLSQAHKRAIGLSTLYLGTEE